MKAVLPHTVRQFARAIIMPNLKPPVRSVADAASLGAPRDNFNTAEAVEFLNTLSLSRAADTLAALPLPRAVKMLEQPELNRGGDLVAAMPVARAAALLGLMADDRATDIVHELDEDERARLIPLLSPEARKAIQQLLSYPAHTAGALMTTEFVSVPSDWTVQSNSIFSSLSPSRQLPKSADDTKDLVTTYSLSSFVNGAPKAFAMVSTGFYPRAGFWLGNGLYSLENYLFCYESAVALANTSKWVTDFTADRSGTNVPAGTQASWETSPIPVGVLGAQQGQFEYVAPS